jgi:hypothetical protein
MRRLEFYKPQKSGNGACCTLQYTNDPEDNKKTGFYINIVKQSSWNESSRTGSFKENVNNPEKHKKIKLNENEIASIINVIESNGSQKFSTVHVNGQNKTPFFFEPFLRENIFVGYLLKISTLSIAFTLPESINIREYCKASLREIYSSLK